MKVAVRKIYTGLRIKSEFVPVCNVPRASSIITAAGPPILDRFMVTMTAVCQMFALAAGPK